MHDEDLDGATVAAGLDGRRTGVARGGADDGDGVATSGELVVEQPPDEL
jgi:hypothetical protein